MLLDQVASGILYANYDRMGTAVVHCVTDSIADGIRVRFIMCLVEVRREAIFRTDADRNLLKLI